MLPILCQRTFKKSSAFLREGIRSGVSRIHKLHFLTDTWHAWGPGVSREKQAPPHPPPHHLHPQLTCILAFFFHLKYDIFYA